MRDCSLLSLVCLKRILWRTEEHRRNEGKGRKDDNQQADNNPLGDTRTTFHQVSQTFASCRLNRKGQLQAEERRCAGQGVQS